jgi:hypothetical protein
MHFASYSLNNSATLSVAFCRHMIDGLNEAITVANSPTKGEMFADSANIVGSTDNFPPGGTEREAGGWLESCGWAARPPRQEHEHFRAIANQPPDAESHWPTTRPDRSLSRRQGRATEANRPKTRALPRASVQ